MQKPVSNSPRFSRLAAAGASLLSLGLAVGCGADADSTPDARQLTDAPVGGTDASVTDASVTDASVTDAGLADATVVVPDATIVPPDAMLPTGNSNAVWAGDFDTNGVDAIAFFDGTTATPLMIPGTTTLDNYHSLAISPDGSQVAIGLERDGGTPQLVVANLDGSGVITVLVDDQVATVNFKSIVWSPDGLQLAYTSDVELNGQDLAYVVLADGSAAAVLVSQNPGDTGLDVRDLRWVSNTAVAYRADMIVGGVDNLYVSDLSVSPIVPTPLVPENLVSNGAEVSGAAGVAGGKVYFRSSHAGSFSFYQVDPDGSNLEVVPFFALLMNGGGSAQAQLGNFTVSPDGTMIAFSADSPTADLYQVFVAPIGGSATVQSDISTATPTALTGPNFFTSMVWSADQSMIAVVADWPVAMTDLDNDFGAFIIPSSGTPGGVRIWTVGAAASNQDVASVVFSSDSSALYTKADIVTNNNTEVYMTTDLTTADQDNMTTRVEEVPTGGDVFDLFTVP